MTRSTLLGREQTIDAILRVIDEGYRVVTLFGPPGVGKSRVLEQVVSDARDRFDASPLLRPRTATGDDLLRASAIALGISLDDEPEPWLRLLRVLKRRGRVLLVVDDVDDPKPLVPLFRQLLEETDDVVVLIASRQVLGVANEVPIELRPLSLLSENDRPSDAAVLFRQLALGRAPDLVTAPEDVLDARIESIVGELEGMPAAIELAAAMLRTMTLEEIYENLQASRVRSQMLHESTERIAESVSLAWQDLAHDEREGLASLTLSESGFSPATAAETMGVARDRALALLDGFRSRSLVTTRVVRGRMRFEMLREVRRAVRKHATAEALESARRRNLDALARRSLELARLWFFSGMASALWQLRDDDSSLEAAIRDPRATPHDRLACGVSLAVARLDAAPIAALAILDHVERDAPAAAFGTLVRAAALVELGRASALRYVLDDLARESDGEVATMALLFESAFERGSGRADRAKISAEAAREKALDLGHRALEACADVALAHAVLRGGDVERARHLASGARYVVDETQHARMRTHVHLLLALAELHATEPHEAAAHLKSAIESAREIGDVRHEVTAQVLLGWVRAAEGRDVAARFVLRAEHRAREAGVESNRLLSIARAFFSEPIAPALEAVSESAALAGDRVVRELADALLQRIDPNRRASEVAYDALLEPFGGEDLALATRLARGAEERAVGPHARWVARWFAIGRRASEPAARRDESERETLAVRRDGRAFRMKESDWITLPKGSPVCNVLVCLAELGSQRPGQRVPLELLIERGWPGERILQKAARSRVYMAISKLRADGLRDLLLRDEDGYFLDPSLEIALVD